MVVTTCLTEFVNKNGPHVRRIISFKTQKKDKPFLDDMCQDFYYYMVRYRTLNGFNMASANPNKDQHAAYTTWIFTAICNFLANKRRSKERKTEKVILNESSLSGRNSYSSAPDMDRARSMDSLYLRSGERMSPDDDTEVESFAVLGEFIKFLELEEPDSNMRNRLVDMLSLASTGLTGKEISRKIGMSTSYVSLLRAKARPIWDDFESLNGKALRRMVSVSQ